MLTFYKVKDAIPGNDESKKIKKMEKAIKETNKSLKKTADEEASRVNLELLFNSIIVDNSKVVNEFVN